MKLKLDINRAGRVEYCCGCLEERLIGRNRVGIMLLKRKGNFFKLLEINYLRVTLGASPKTVEYNREK